MFLKTKQSQGYGVQICYLFSDSGLLADEDVPSHKFKIFNAQSIKSQSNRSAEVSQWLKAKSESTDIAATDKGKGKATAKPPKPSKSKAAELPKTKGKRKVTFVESEEEKTPSPKLIRKPRSTKAKPAESVPEPIIPTEEAYVPVVIADPEIEASVPIFEESIVPTDEVVVPTVASVATTSGATESTSAKKSSKKRKHSKVIPAPQQEVVFRPALPPARPIGRILKGSVQTTLSGLDLFHCYKNPTQSAGKVITTEESRPNNAIQLLIDLSMDTVNSMAEEQLKIYDE